MICRACNRKLAFAVKRAHGNTVRAAERSARKIEILHQQVTRPTKQLNYQAQRRLVKRLAEEERRTRDLVKQANGFAAQHLRLTGQDLMRFTAPPKRAR